MAAQLSPDNALEVWRIAESFSLPALEKAAVEWRAWRLRGASAAAGLGLAGASAAVQEEMLLAKDEAAVFRKIVRWSEAVARPKAAS